MCNHNEENLAREINPNEVKNNHREQQLNFKARISGKF